LEASCLGAAAIFKGISPLRFAPVEMTGLALRSGRNDNSWFCYGREGMIDATFKTFEKPLQRK